MTPDVTFGAVSLQLKVLADAGLVESKAAAQFRVYCVRRETLGPLAGMLEAMWADALWHLKLKAELRESRRGPQPRKRLDSHPAGTLVQLTHEFADAAVRDHHVQGWRFQLSLFANAMAGSRR